MASATTSAVKTVRGPAPSDAADRPDAAFAADVIAGLTAKPKRLSPKYFYDAAGSALFERITQLPEYYPTRCEIGAVTRARAGDRLAVPAELRA